MRKSFLLLTTSALLAIMCPACVFAQRLTLDGNRHLTIVDNNYPPQTVFDYFLLLPDKYIGASQDERLGWLLPSSDSVIDNPNDFLHCGGDSGQMVMDIALFRYHGQVTVGVLDYGYDPQEPTLNFLRYEHRQWRDVTASVLPIKIKPSYYFHLPRQGTTIDIYNRHDLYGDPDQFVCRLLWRNGKFVVARKQVR